MIAPAFGFSIGDFIAGIQIAKKAVEALSDANGAPYEYTLTMMWLQATERTLRHVQALQETSATSELVQQVPTLAHACAIPVSKFLTKIQPYEMYLEMTLNRQSEQCLPFSFRRTSYKVRWALSTMNSLDELNKQIAPVLDQIAICLLLLGRKRSEEIQEQARVDVLSQTSKIADLETAITTLRDTFQQATLNSSQRKDQFSGELIHIHIGVRKWTLRQWDSSSIINAVPFEYFRHWPTFRSHLLHEFEESGGIEDIDSGDGVLHCIEAKSPRGRPPKKLEPPEGWAMMVNPGTKLELTITEEQWTRRLCLSGTFPHMLGASTISPAARWPGEEYLQLMSRVAERYCHTSRGFTMKSLNCRYRRFYTSFSKHNATHFVGGVIMTAPVFR